MNSSMISDPIIQRLIIGLACGLLIGFGFRIFKCFLEVGASLVALAILYCMVTGDYVVFEDIQFDKIKLWLAGIRYEIAGLFTGFILSHSVKKRPHGEKKQYEN